jgi:hypothetical protein
MIEHPMLYLAAGLMTISAASARSGFVLDAEPRRIAVPPWAPYAVLGVLAVASIAAAIIFPEVGAAWAD